MNVCYEKQAFSLKTYIMNCIFINWKIILSNSDTLQTFFIDYTNQNKSFQDSIWLARDIIYMMISK